MTQLYKNIFNVLTKNSYIIGINDKKVNKQIMTFKANKNIIKYIY